MKTQPAGKGDGSVSSMAESGVVVNMSTFLTVSLEEGARGRASQQVQLR